MSVLGWVAGAWVALGGLAYAGQRAMMYPAPKSGAEPRVAGAELLRLPGGEGRTVYALYRPADEAGAPTIVHFHGNGEELADQAWLVGALGRRGIGVLAVEYPGYGLARDYRTTESAIYADADAAVRHVRTQLGVPDERVVIQGQSLGTGVAVEMARRGYGARVVLLSPFTSMVDMARRIAPFLPVGTLVRDRYESAKKAPEVTQPALVVHGTNDELIPIEMGRAIARALRSAELHEVAGGGHNDLFARNGEGLVERIAEFARGG